MGLVPAKDTYWAFLGRLEKLSSAMDANGTRFLLCYFGAYKGCPGLTSQRGSRDRKPLLSTYWVPDPLHSGSA